MKAFSKMLMAAAIVPAFLACSSDNEDFLNDNPADNDGRREIVLDFKHPASTRATDTNFEVQDSIGVYMVLDGQDLQIGGNELNNELFVHTGSAWKSLRKAYWNEGAHNIYAYYPYVKSISDVENYAFTVCENQNGAGYEKSDFLWASAENVAASTAPVSMAFSHCMSRVKVVLEKSADYSGDIPSDCKVFIHNMVPTALVDLETGAVEASPYAGVKTIQCRKLGNTEYVACIVPQRISTRRPIVEVTTSNVSYLLEGTISLKQGYQSTITVTLTQSPQQVAIEIGGSMGTWE